ncbi:MAG: hypothetical protein QNK23_10750 [Crocinitomicaceae bacterium]|nr:hypothetical protein [Crocinitomicaceae bacterium]
MRLLLSMCILLFTGVYVHSQETSPEKLITQELAQEDIFLANNQLTLTLDLRNFSQNIQGMLKDDFTLFHEKVVSINLDDNNIMVIRHARLLTEREVMELLTKYSIDEGAIISYQ